MKSNLPSFLKNIKFYSIQYNKFGERIGKTSKYYIDKNSRYFMKKPINILSVLQREIYILKYLNQKKYKWCPKLLYHNHKLFITEHVGSPITARNIPRNYHKQMKNILNDLKKCRIKHNDIKLNEILVKKGRLHLVDFGWATQYNDPSCGQKNITPIINPGIIYKDRNILRLLDKLYRKKFYNSNN